MRSELKQGKSELALQSQCFQWHWNTFPSHRQMLFHVQNKARNKIEGSKFKAMGVVKGVSDLVYISHGEVSFIEMKTGTEQSAEQKSFEVKVRARKHNYFIIRSFEEFKDLILFLHQKHYIVG